MTFQKEEGAGYPEEMAGAGEGEDGSRGSPDAAADYSSDVSSPRAALDVAIAGSTDSDSSCSSKCCGAVAEEPRSPQWRGLIKGLLQGKKSVRRSPTFPPPTTPEVTRWKLLRKLERTRTSRKNRAGELPLALPPPPPPVRWRPTWRSFELKELAAATDDFSSENLIGRGGHAEVYRGRLACGQLVAVKRLTKKDMEEERVADFLSELGIIAHVNHPNAAHLIGFGVEGGLHLVLQYSPHGSLASVLHGSGKEAIEWGVRLKIAQGVAEGLRYLHEGCHRRIIHRDIKASNILLTEDYRPQISDFGLAKWLPDSWPYHVVFPIEGTFGYLAPEYFMHGLVNEKTDVFSFGVLLLELITGRLAVDSSRRSLVIWAKPLLDAGNLEELVDPSLKGSYDPQEMDSAVTVASACIHHLPAARPRMNQALQLLRGEDETIESGVDEGASKPASALDLFEACDLGEDYSSSRYLSDLNRHRKLALEQ